MLEKFAKKYTQQLYVVFRVMVGALFLQHGVQKLFGALGGTQQPLTSLMGLAGVIELVVGIFVLVGLFTRVTALVGAVEMLAAYGMAHFGRGWAPVTNGGELALLFFASFLVLIAYGGGKWAVDAKLLKS